MDFREQLLSEKKQLTDKLNAVTLALKAYGFTDDFTEKLTDDESSFPFDASREKRIFWLLQHNFKRAVKLPELISAYKKYAGTDVAMDNLCRNMKKEGKLCYVKYNGKNRLCYWGLPNWISLIDGKDFEEQFKPSDPYLDEIYSSEIIKE